MSKDAQIRDFCDSLKVSTRNDQRKEAAIEISQTTATDSKLGQRKNEGRGSPKCREVHFA